MMMNRSLCRLLLLLFVFAHGLEEGEDEEGKPILDGSNSTTASTIDDHDQSSSDNNNNNNNNNKKFRAIYKGRFQILADGCTPGSSGPLLKAICGGGGGHGGNITLLTTSHPSVVCEAEEQAASEEAEQQIGDKSTLACHSICPFAAAASPADSVACQGNTYLNDGTYTTTEGPWGEIVYQCEGHSLEEVDTRFVFEAGERQDASCTWRWFFDNELYHIAQLGILCDPEIMNPNQNDQNNNNNNNNETNTTNTTTTTTTTTTITSIPEEAAIVSRVSSSSAFVYEDTYLECSRGDSVALDFEGPNNHDVFCSVGQNCGGEDCQVEMHTITVHADVHRFANECIQQDDITGVVPTDEETTTTTTTTTETETLEATEASESTTTTTTTTSSSSSSLLLPKGNYTIQFQVGWSLLMKNPDYWYNNGDIDFVRHYATVLQFTCTNGIDIQYMQASNPDMIGCTTTWPEVEEEEEDDHDDQDDKKKQTTLFCRVPVDMQEEGYVNSFYTVTYSCTAIDELPTTSATIVENQITCVEDIFDDLVVGHALQIGHFCSSIDAANHDDDADVDASTNSQQQQPTGGGGGGEYHFQDYDYECGSGRSGTSGNDPGIEDNNDIWNHDTSDNNHQYLLLNDETEALGDRFTCMKTVPITQIGIPTTIPKVSMRTDDWRFTRMEEEDEGEGDGGLDPSCFVFHPLNTTTTTTSIEEEGTEVATNTTTNSSSVP